MKKENIKNLLDLSKHYLRVDNFSYAKKILNIIIDFDPECFEANEILARVYEQEGNLLISCKYLKHVLLNKKATSQNYYKLGSLQLILKDYEAAKITFKNALEKFGESFDILHDLGIVFASLGEGELALSCFNRALNFKKDSPELFFNIAKIYDEAGLHIDAMANYDKSIEVDSTFTPAFHNKGALLRDLCQYDRALFYFDQAIKINPRDYDSICSISTIHLLTGDFKKGWDAYQYRWKQIPPENYRYPIFKELQSLEAINNKNILVWYEQGLGDTIQFSRYVLKLISLGANVTFEVQEPLNALFKDQFNCRVVSAPLDGRSFDYQIPLLSLPNLCRTDLSTIFSSKSYLSVRPDKVCQWQDKLNLSKAKINIAIAISGNLDHINNQNRSISLKYFEPIIDIANLYIVQKELSAPDAEYANLRTEVFFLGELIDDFQDSAAIVEIMDLVISVDTSLIHLAGALGKKSFLMLPLISEWRWLLNRTDSPWYDSIKIFRQSELNDWITVVDRVKKELLSSV